MVTFEIVKEVWVLDRPNPAGRPVEGTMLVPGQESFVGAAPMPMRHGLTLGESAKLFKYKFNVDCELEIIKIKDWKREITFDQTDLTKFFS